MTTKTIDFGDEANEGISTGLLFEEFEIIKVEKLQKLDVSSHLSTKTYIDVANRVATSSTSDTKTKTNITTTIFLDNNEHFTLSRDAKLLEGWHIRVIHLLCNDEKYHHATYCVEAKEFLLGTNTPPFKRLVHLRWREKYKNELSKIPKERTIKESTFMIIVITAIAVICEYKFLWRTLVERNIHSIVSLVVLNGLFFFGALFVASLISAVLNFGTAAFFSYILNAPKRKKYASIVAKEHDLPPCYEQIQQQLDTFCPQFIQQGMNSIPDIKTVGEKQ